LVTVSILVLLAGGALATAGMMIYAAQPWGDNYAYQSVAGYLSLLLFMGWAISPYVALMVTTVWLAGPGAGRWMVLAGALLITVFGTWLTTEAIIIHPDAQGGLVFIFLPLYQWLVVAAIVVSGLWLKRR
jgi:hypothetical protein